jgi:hypothetical protein
MRGLGCGYGYSNRERQRGDGMSGAYRRVLDDIAGVFMFVEYKIEQRGPGVVDYSVVLIVEVDGRLETVRVYDGAHGENELHRYTQAGGKQVAEVFDGGTLGEGMRAATKEIRQGYEAMIEAWNKQ